MTYGHSPARSPAKHQTDASAPARAPACHCRPEVQKPFEFRSADHVGKPGVHANASQLLKPFPESQGLLQTPFPTSGDTTSHDVGEATWDAIVPSAHKSEQHQEHKSVKEGRPEQVREDMLISAWTGSSQSRCTSEEAVSKRRQLDDDENSETDESLDEHSQSDGTHGFDEQNHEPPRSSTSSGDCRSTSTQPCIEESKMMPESSNKLLIHVQPQSTVFVSENSVKALDLSANENSQDTFMESQETPDPGSCNGEDDLLESPTFSDMLLIGAGPTQSTFRAQVVAHPLFSQLLKTHFNCLGLVSPIHRLSSVDEKMKSASNLYAQYLNCPPTESRPVASGSHEEQRLDELLEKILVEMMTYEASLMRSITPLVSSADAYLWHIKKAHCEMTGESHDFEDCFDNGPTMSDDEEEDFGGDGSYWGAGSSHTIPEDLDERIERELYGVSAEDRATMWLVRERLVGILGIDSYSAKIRETREEILRKRKAGKLPNRATDGLKAWWTEHIDWPYPTEGEKQELMKATRLDLKQVNNWFINQRKRNWHEKPDLNDPNKKAKQTAPDP